MVGRFVEQIRRNQCCSVSGQAAASAAPLAHFDLAATRRYSDGADFHGVSRAVGPPALLTRGAEISFVGAA